MRPISSARSYMWRVRGSHPFLATYLYPLFLIAFPFTLAPCPSPRHAFDPSARYFSPLTTTPQATDEAVVRGGGRAKVTCQEHYAASLPECAGCGKKVDLSTQQGLRAADCDWHADCFRCQVCNCELWCEGFRTVPFVIHEGQVLCKKDLVAKLRPQKSRVNLSRVCWPRPVFQRKSVF